MSTCPDCGLSHGGTGWETDACIRNTLTLLRQILAASEANSQGFAKLAFEEGQKSFALEKKLSTVEAKLVETARENKAWRALAAESSGRASSLDFSHNDADSYEAEIVDYPGFGHVVATDGVYHNASFQDAAVALATKLGLLDKEGG